ncbi:MAG: NAD(P)H-dependent flavin oxidoreductase, partial [Candidatus Dadabacteria bacterium]
MAGGLGSIGAGYLSPEQIEAGIRKVKELTKRPFSVNLFIPEISNTVESDDKVLKKLEEFSVELGVGPPEVPRPPEYTFEDQLSVIIDHNVPVFSFTFGIPDKALIRDLIERDVFVIGTATCVEEGVLLEEAGCSAIVAQGSEAGGHRGTFGSTEGTPMIGGLALVPQLVDKVEIPVIASGGIMDGRGIAASVALGASTVQMGTAFLSCKEAGVPKPWLDSLLSSKDISTVLTKAFSGKYARGIKNRFIDEMSLLEDEIPNYPLQNSLTRSLRNASKDKGDSDFMSLWAGQGSAMSRKLTAQELVDCLISETYEVFKSISSNL